MSFVWGLPFAITRGKNEAAFSVFGVFASPEDLRCARPIILVQDRQQPRVLLNASCIKRVAVYHIITFFPTLVLRRITADKFCLGTLPGPRDDVLCPGSGPAGDTAPPSCRRAADAADVPC